MRIDDNFRIEGDNLEVRLIEAITTSAVTNAGGETITAGGKNRDILYHFPTVKMALKAYLDRAIRPAESVEDLIERIDQVEFNIDNLKL